MMLAVTSQGQNLDAPVDARFGRCRFFVVVDSDTMDTTAIENPNARQGGGAGIQAAQLVADKGVEHVITGHCGPNAFRALDAAGIEVSTGAQGTVRDAVNACLAGKLETLTDANVGSHFGMGSGKGGTTSV